MTKRRVNRYLYKIPLLTTIIFFSLISFRLSAEQAKEIIEIKVFPDQCINEHFYGFGAETLPWLWTKENREAGVKEEDIRLNLERIRDMQLPITRIFIPWETWNPSIDYKTFAWDSDKMKSLYKTLDLYQEMGTKVILVTVDWLKDSPWKNTQASSYAVLELLEYLIKDKGYDCIYFWTLTNEPELTYDWLKKMPFDNYVKIHRLVKKGIKEKGLSVKIIASDEVESPQWFKKSLQSLYSKADIFSSHLYLYPQQANLIPNFLKERLNMINKSSLNKKKPAFFICEFGFRGPDFSSCSNSLMRDYEYGLYVASFCVDALNSGIDAASLWCLHQIRLIDETDVGKGKIMRIGLWAFKDKNWHPFPIFYLYRVFTRYIKYDSKVLKTETFPTNILKVACVEYRGSYSLAIINMSNANHHFLIKGINLGPNFKRYLYSKSNFSPIQEDLLRADNKIKIDKYLKDKIPPCSVIFYTSLIKDK